MMNPEQVDALWTVDQVAAYMQMSRSWVYKRVAADEIPCIRLGASVRFVPESIRRFVASRAWSGGNGAAATSIGIGAGTVEVPHG